MKHFKSIIGISFVVLLITVVLFTLFVENNEQFLLLAVISIAAFNLIMGIIKYKNGQKTKAHTFILSGLLVLLIGGSSCVTIKFKRERIIIPKPIQKKPDSLIS